MGKITTAVDAPTAVEKKLAILKTEATEVEQIAADFQVQTAEDYERLTAFLARISRVKKALQAEAKVMLDPLKEHIKDLQARYFKGPLDALESADDTARSKGSAFLRDQERQRQAAEYRRQQEQKKRETEARKFGEAAPKPQEPLHVEEAPKTVHTEEGSATRTKFRDYKLTDINAVPDKYLKKEVRRQAVLDALNKEGVKEIPGLEVFEDFRQSIKTAQEG